MGQLANSVGSCNLQGHLPPRIRGLDAAGSAELGRVIPGGGRSRTTARRNSLSARPHQPEAGHASVFWFQPLASVLPDCFKSLVPEMLGWALADTTLIAGIFLLEFASIARSLNTRVVVFYLAVFLMLALQSRLYADEFKTQAAEQIALCKSLFWTCLLTLMPLSRASVKGTFFPLVLFTAVNASVLSLSREMWRVVTRSNQRSGSRSVLIIGEPDFAHRLAKAIEQDGCGRRTVRGIVSERELRHPQGTANVQKLARQASVDELIIASRDSEVVHTAAGLARLDRLDLLFAPDLGGVAATRIETLDGLLLLKIHEQAHPEWALAVKRISDFVISSLLLFALSPLLLLIAIAIRLDSRGPALYHAPRVGRKGQRFNCVKFRTMVPNADALKQELRAHNQRDGAFFKLAADPRITRIGRALRRYSLDELPQLWNVVVGDMSLVGPRPHPPDDVERYNLGDLRRLDFTPGMTGLWQVSARQDPSFRRCVALDVQYISEWSLLLDLSILWRTVAVVLQGSGV